jgi:hypothetical protein
VQWRAVVWRGGHVDINAACVEQLDDDLRVAVACRRVQRRLACSVRKERIRTSESREQGKIEKQKYSKKAKMQIQ